jgi:hypothetical protein
MVAYECPLPSCKIGSCRKHMALFLNGSEQTATYILGFSCCSEDAGKSRSYFPMYNEELATPEDGVIMEPSYDSEDEEPYDLRELLHEEERSEVLENIWDVTNLDDIGPCENFESPEDLFGSEDICAGNIQNGGIGSDGNFQYLDNSGYDIS